VPVPAAADLKHLGAGPTIFDRDRQLADAFIQEIASYFYINKGVPGFDSPLRKVAITLMYIKGPKVDGWADDMAVWLDSLHPVNDNYDYIWDRFIEAFAAQFQDSTKQQRAHMMLDTIAFKFPEIDQYISEFEDLARKAGYTVGNNETVSLFLRGLRTLADVFERVINKDPQNYFQLKDATITVTKNQQLLNALRKNTLATNPLQ